MGFLDTFAAASPVSAGAVFFARGGILVSLHEVLKRVCRVLMSDWINGDEMVVGFWEKDRVQSSLF
jgi:hypothetical protein